MNKIIHHVTEHLKSKTLVGLIILLPVVIVIWFIRFAVNITDDIVSPVFPFVPTVHLLPKIPGLGLIALLIAAYLIGLVSSPAYGKEAIKHVQNVLHKIPIYTMVRNWIERLAGHEQHDRPVVLVDYPLTLCCCHEKRTTMTKSFALCMAETEVDGIPHVVVLIATPPFPNNGWLLLYPANQVQKTTLKAMDYVQFIVSLGTSCPCKVNTLGHYKELNTPQS